MLSGFQTSYSSPIRSFLRSLNQGAWKNHSLASTSRFPTCKAKLNGLIDEQCVQLPCTTRANIFFLQTIFHWGKRERHGERAVCRSGVGGRRGETSRISTITPGVPNHVVCPVLVKQRESSFSHLSPCPASSSRLLQHLLCWTLRCDEISDDTFITCITFLIK